jgi:putative DNA primase/helicase
MLDPTITPTKAVFLFGAARSGKSTYLRLLQEIAGPENYSAVTLHQLSDDRFAAANLYGKMLNVAADLPASHVEDLSTFKMMTGRRPCSGKP